MATDTVANATKVVQLATGSFQAVGELVTSSKLIKDVGCNRLQPKLVNWEPSSMFLVAKSN